MNGDIPEMVKILENPIFMTPYEDEFPLSQESVNAVLEVLRGASASEAEGRVYPDGCGGVEVAWRLNGKVVILASRKKRLEGVDTWLYQADIEKGDGEYFIYRPATSEKLDELLDWILEDKEPK